MTELDFLRSILETPDNDDLRLVFADWLDEQDDPRGELMRVQVELSQRPASAAIRRRLEQRNRDILAHHSNRWLGPLKPHAGQFAFNRGTLHLWTKANPLLGPHLEAPEAAKVCRWIESLTLSGLAASEVPYLEHFPHLTRLDLSRSSLEAETIDTLSGLPALNYLQTLELGGGPAGRKAVRLLTRAASLPRLRVLGLGRNGLDQAAIHELSATDRLPNLAVLNLSGNSFPGSALPWRGVSPLLFQLQALDLSSTELGDSSFLGPATLPAGTVLPLTSLDLSCNLLSDGAAQGLAREPALSRLAALGMNSTYIADAGLIALACSPYLSSLASLQLNWTRVGDNGVIALCESPLASRLTRLELVGCPLGDSGGLALTHSTGLRRLAHLRLSARFSSAVTASLSSRFGGALAYF